MLNFHEEMARRRHGLRMPGLTLQHVHACHAAYTRVNNINAYVIAQARDIYNLMVAFYICNEGTCT